MALSQASGYQLPKSSIRHIPDTTAATPSSLSSSRRQFHKLLISTTISTASLPFFQPTAQSNAFEGGVGGLGKTKPNTGVIFANPDLIIDPSSISTPGSYSSEIIGPDGTAVVLSFYAAWPMLKSQGIESRDLANAESSFVQVAMKPSYVSIDSSSADMSTVTLKKQFFAEAILSQSGKYGMYGEPTDVKVIKVDPSSGLYLLSFTTLTPSMRESDRRAYVATKIVGDGVYMLVAGSSLVRFKGQDSLLRKVADSFEVLEAPKSSLRR